MSYLYMVKTENRVTGATKHDFVVAVSEDHLRARCEDGIYRIVWFTTDVNDMRDEVETEYDGLALVCSQ